MSIAARGPRTALNQALTSGQPLAGIVKQVRYTRGESYGRQYNFPRLPGLPERGRDGPLRPARGRGGQLYARLNRRAGDEREDSVPGGALVQRPGLRADRAPRRGAECSRGGPGTRVTALAAFRLPRPAIEAGAGLE